MISCKSFFAWLFLLLVGVASAVAGDFPQILRVERKAQSSTFDKTSINNVQNRYMTKFLDQVDQLNENFEVEWAAYGKGLPSGACVVFTYRLGASEDVYGKSFCYKNSVRGKRIEHFQFTTVAWTKESSIRAWRVCIVLNGKTLAEKKSSSWR